MFDVVFRKTTPNKTTRPDMPVTGEPLRPVILEPLEQYNQWTY